MSPRRVLIAEDSPTQAAVLRANLEDAGYEVLVAGNGAEALEVMAVQPSIDIVVSDVVMPDVDGYELCREVKERHPNTPVVLLTSMSDPLDVVNALSAGADNFMRKPYEPTELIHRIGNMLHNKQLREAGRTQMGLELFFLGRRFMINADREQILDLLVSTFEDLVSVNRRLSAREEDLAIARDELAARLHESEGERERLNAVLGAVPGGMAVIDLDARIVHANAKLAELVDLPLSQLNGSVVWDVVRFVDQHGSPVPNEARAMHESLCTGHGAVRGSAFELFLDHADGVRFPVVARAEPVFAANGELIGSVGTLEDLRTVMDHDPATGLPGEGVLLDRLQTAADRGIQRDAKTALLVVVVDRFERFRDSLPGPEIERLLAVMSSRLQDTLHADEVTLRAPAASAAYLGNGEFAVVVSDIEGEDDATLISQHIVDQVTDSFETDGLQLPVTVSVAVAMCDDAIDAPTLVASAAGSAREASREGGGRVAVSDPSRHGQVMDFLRRENELRDALESDQLVVHYQPHVRVRNECPVGVEALVRWQHPDRGLLGADQIIPLAIESGLIARLGWIVLETACRQAATWHRSVPAGMAPELSVNMAPEQLSDPAAVGRIAAILERTGFDAADLVLEITEGTLMEDPAAAGERLARIKALGCRIAVDDFGTGYSSLLQLRRLPVDVLKIDRGFISGMLDEPADAAIVSTVIRLARALGLEVIAEGVENADQLVQLRVMGCDSAQGYHWSRPVPADDLETWWEANTVTDMIDAEVEGPRDPLVADGDYDEVLSYLVHELRTPLTAVQGFAELLQEAVPESSAALVDPIVRNARELDHRLSSLSEVNDLLRGGMTLRTEDHDIAAIVKTLVEDMSGQLAPHAVAFSATGTAVASVDRPRFLQAVSNLVTNAAKFSPDGAPIEVTVTAVGGVVAIEVRDHGPGVPPERRPELFRRFSRLGSVATGMGLGLFLARLVVEAHGGVIGYRDGPDGGAVFFIRIPRRSTIRRDQLVTAMSGEPVRESEAGSSTVDGRPSRSRPQILCVEDDQATASLIQRVLDGCHVRVASGAREALVMAAQAPVDLVLLDRHLGDLGYEELLGGLRALPATAEVPLLLLTAAPDHDTAEDQGVRGADAVLAKPFRPEDLRRTVEALLSGRPLPERLGSQPAAPTTAPLDESLLRALEEMADGAGGAIHDLVEVALADAGRCRVALREAVGAADERAVTVHAHSLQGTLGSFGAHVVAERCLEMEVAATSGDRTLLERALERLEQAVGDAEQALRARFTDR